MPNVTSIRFFILFFNIRFKTVKKIISPKTVLLELVKTEIGTITLKKKSVFYFLTFTFLSAEQVATYLSSAENAQQSISSS